MEGRNSNHRQEVVIIFLFPNTLLILGTIVVTDKEKRKWVPLT